MLRLILAIAAAIILAVIVLSVVSIHIH